MLYLLPESQEFYSHGEKKTVWLLRLEKTRNLEFEQLCQLIASRTTLNEYEVEFVINELYQVIVENAEIGRGVDLGRLGKMVISVASQTVDAPEKLDLKAVKKVNIRYKPSMLIKKAFKDFRFRISR